LRGTSGDVRFSTTFIDLKNHIYFSGTGITGGVALLPYKIRPKIKINNEKKGFDFSKDITLGVSGGIKQRFSRYSPFS